MRRFVLGLFAAIGIVTVLAVVGLGVAMWRIAASTPSLPGTIVLRADLTRGLAEGASPSPLATLLYGSRPNLRDFLDALDRAGRDARVKGIYARVGADNIGLAKIQQVRDAIRAFRAKGKFAIAFADSFGEFGPGTRPYYLATAFDQIWLQPLGSVGLIGLHTEVPFLRGTLDKLGLVPSFDHREQYKTAMNSLTETTMTPAQREEVEDLLGNTSDQIVAGIAAARKLSKEQVAALIDQGPFLATQAKAMALVDRIGYSDQAMSEARRRAGSGAKLVKLLRYLRGAGRPHESGPKIALIYGTGLITAGDDASNPLIGSSEMTARKMVRAFRQAARAKDVRAILFRIDSPGGSAVASETIWRAVEEARKRGKPVIVSMGDVAGSGGYYIAAPATRIVAEPATLTGSIGVLAGKIVIAGLLKKIGVVEESAQRGANAAMFSAYQDFSPVAHARLEAFLDDTYTGFKKRVAAGRHMSAEQVEAVAKGRVWTGKQAKQKGLVDALGGYATALRLARQAAGIRAGAKVHLVVYPKEKSTIEKIYDRLVDRASGGGEAVGGSAQNLMAGAGRVLTLLQAVAGNAGVLRMPAIGEIR